MSDTLYAPIREAINEARVLIACALARPVPSDVSTVTRRDRWVMAFAETHLPVIVGALENAIELAERLQQGDRHSADVALNRFWRSLSVYVPADAAEACADKLELLRLRTQGVLTAQLQERIARMGRELDQCYATIGRLEEETVRAKSVRERLGRDVSAPGHPGDPEDLL